VTIALSFENFGFTYTGETKPSLTGVTLQLPAGRLVSIVAPQGTGKTTLLRAAAGLFETLDERGVITGGSPRRLEGELPGSFFDGYVQVTLAVETVREEIALPLHATKGLPDHRADRVEAVARELNIEHLLDREVTALSGGEEKLVGIAAALVIDSYLYVLDEPFEQLDVAHCSAVIRAIKRRARQGALVLVASGSVDIALNISDHVVVFDGSNWRLLEQPTYADVATIPGLTSSSLGQFLSRRAIDLTGIRRFRDGVRRST
jgi:sn-glycerol 3-phosphate transport system ATP-binding protein